MYHILHAKAIFWDMLPTWTDTRKEPTMNCIEVFEIHGCCGYFSTLGDHQFHLGCTYQCMFKRFWEKMFFLFPGKLTNVPWKSMVGSDVFPVEIVPKKRVPRSPFRCLEIYPAENRPVKRPIPKGKADFPKHQILRIHPWRLTWNIIMDVWKIIFLSKWVICRFHVHLPGCKHTRCPFLDNPRPLGSTMVPFRGFCCAWILAEN